MPDTTSMYVIYTYTHDHACRWQGKVLSRVYPVWRDGTCNPERMLCADMGVELPLVSRVLKDPR